MSVRFDGYFSRSLGFTSLADHLRCIPPSVLVVVLIPCLLWYASSAESVWGEQLNGDDEVASFPRAQQVCARLHVGGILPATVYGYRRYCLRRRQWKTPSAQTSRVAKPCPSYVSRVAEAAERRSSDSGVAEGFSDADFRSSRWLVSIVQFAIALRVLYLCVN